VAECHPGRFRLGDKKEAAGVCRGCGESMGIESEHTRNQMFSSIKESRFKLSASPHTDYGTVQRPRRLRLRSCRLNRN
jgi:hypothetical protein